MVHRIPYDVHREGAVPAAVNRVIAAAPGIWLYYCYNAEYLFHPFCETRNIREMLAFHTEERRDAMLTYVIDLYAGDLGRYPDAVSLEAALLDRSGYYALGRPDADGNPKERQLDFFGGLRWRFEEHVPKARRKIDRIALFRARQGLRLRDDHTFNDRGIQHLFLPLAPQHHRGHRLVPHRQGAEDQSRLDVRHPQFPLAQLDPVRVAVEAIDGPGADGTGPVVLKRRF